MCRSVFLLGLCVLSACTRSNTGLVDEDMSMSSSDGGGPPGPDLMCGGPEICGDNLDNNCNMTADEGCNGLGTFVSNLGSDSNPGTKMQPLLTITKGIDNARTIGGGVDVFVAGGNYSEKVKLVEGISLFGGYECNISSCSWVRDLAKQDTAILNTDDEGVLADRTITRATALDGFRVAGKASSSTTAAITIDGGSPTLTNNLVFGGMQSGNALTAAIRVFLPSNDPLGALIDGNQITGGTANELSHGISLAARMNPVVAPAVVAISNNTVVGGAARNTQAISAGPTTAGASIVKNRITGGTSNNAGTSYGIAVAGEILVDGNLINADSAKVGSCGTGSGWCAGLVSFSSKATITNNVIYGVSSGPRSAAVSLLEAEMAAGAVVLNGNYLDGAGGGAGTAIAPQSAAVVLRIGACNTCGFTGVFGKVRNNILSGGRGQQRFGIVEDNAPGKTNVPEVLENNLFHFSPAIGITVDTFYRQWNGVLNTDLKSIDQVNMLTKPPAANNLSGDPMLDMSWHLIKGSPCQDKGTKTEAPALDRDGDVRPAGSAVDVGPDETK
jgi:hypothetical protein